MFKIQKKIEAKAADFVQRDRGLLEFDALETSRCAP